jgi:hypothetical protein
MRLSFTGASVVFDYSYNKPAHELVALGIGVDHEDHVLWTMSYPSYVSYLVTGDPVVF